MTVGGPSERVEPLPEVATARVVPLHEPSEQERIKKDAERERIERALANKREFEAMVQGTTNRLALLPDRTFLANLAFGVANLAFAKIMTGQVPINTAREASDLAKVAIEIGRLESGDPTRHDRPLTEEERQNAIASIAKLSDSLSERAKKLRENPDDGLDETLDDDELTPGSSTNADEPGIIATDATPGSHTEVG